MTGHILDKFKLNLTAMMSQQTTAKKPNPQHLLKNK